MFHADGSNVFEASMPFNAVHDIWPPPDTLSCFQPIEDTGNTVTGNIAHGMECSFEDWQNSGMGNLDIASGAFQESSMDAYMTEVHCNNLEPVSQNERYYLLLRAL